MLDDDHWREGERVEEESVSEKRQKFDKLNTRSDTCRQESLTGKISKKWDGGK